MKKTAPLFVIAAACMWGSMGFFVRHLNDIGLSAMQIVESRSLITALLMLAGLALFRRDLLRVHLRDLWCFAGAGILSVVFFNYCYFTTIRMASLSVAAILLYTAPIFVMLMSLILFHEKLSRRKLAALALAFVGCAFASGVLTQGLSVDARVILLGLGSGFGYALYSIFTRYAILKRYHPFTITAYVFVFATIGGIPLTDFSQIAAVLSGNGGNIAYLLIYTVITTILPYCLYTMGLRFVENGTAAVMASIEPVVAMLFGLLVFHERPTWTGILGIVIVLAALTLLNWPTRSQSVQTEQSPLNC